MINLAIDIGNTRTKVAFFERGQLLSTRSFRNEEPGAHSDPVDGPAQIRELNELIGRYRPEAAILASVVKPAPALIQALEKATRLYYFPGALQLPLSNRYQTAESLGADRLAAVIGAGSYGEAPGRQGHEPAGCDRLVIIAGTCITYNFVNRRNEFLGGAISPGLQMRLEAMHTFTRQLPLIKLDVSYDAFLGRDTRQSLLAGAQTGALGEVEGMIRAYLEQYPGLEVYLSGGDAEFFDKRLKNSIFADRIVLDGEIILKGLDRVLNYQTK